uniref:MORN repeat-containing protein n=1 Tax=Macrostomum lignano TaxID=282301 RepID=A0A1I8G4T8_9PLAT
FQRHRHISAQYGRHRGTRGSRAQALSAASSLALKSTDSALKVPESPPPCSAAASSSSSLSPSSQAPTQAGEPQAQIFCSCSRDWRMPLVLLLILMMLGGGWMNSNTKLFNHCGCDCGGGGCGGRCIGRRGCWLARHQSAAGFADAAGWLQKGDSGKAILEGRFWKGDSGKAILEGRFWKGDSEGRFWKGDSGKAILEGRFWKGDSEGRFWKGDSGKAILEGRFWKGDS